MVVFDLNPGEIAYGIGNIVRIQLFEGFPVEMLRRDNLLVWSGFPHQHEVGKRGGRGVVVGKNREDSRSQHDA